LPISPKKLNPFQTYENQKIKSAEMLLCRTGPLPYKSGKTTGCNIFALVVTQGLRFSKNLLCPCQHTAHWFYLISPEAYLLTFALLGKCACLKHPRAQRFENAFCYLQC